MAIPETLLDGIDQLAPLPLTVQRLLSLLNRDDASMKEIVETIRRDEAITATVLRMANSPVYAGRFHIERVQDAAVRLGTAALLSIAMGNHLGAINTSAPMYDLTENELWLHAVAASLATKAITQESRDRSIPQVAQIAALVHDIGKLIMVRYLNASVATILDLCAQKGICFVDAERELFGCDHAEVGGAIGRKWGFPLEIVTAIEVHHHVPLENPTPLLDAVMLANLIAKSIGVGLGAEGLNLLTDTAHQRERLGLSQEAFERACAQTFVWLESVKTDYGLAA
jgi:putative nucleotidyltransferase with HDIG domain